jgi:hypothetical protein
VRLEDVDGVRAAVAGVPVLGHPDDDPLPRQAVPHEDDPPLVPCDAVAAVGDRADRDLELAADPPAAAVDRLRPPCPSADRGRLPDPAPSVRGAGRRWSFISHRG